LGAGNDSALSLLRGTSAVCGLAGGIPSLLRNAITMKTAVLIEQMLIFAMLIMIVLRGDLSRPESRSVVEPKPGRKFNSKRSVHRETEVELQLAGA